MKTYHGNDWDCISRRQHDLRLRMAAYDHPTLDDLKREAREAGYHFHLSPWVMRSSRFFRELMKFLGIEG